MSLFHGYPRMSSTRDIQEEYEREHDLAAETQKVHFAVAPRCTITTPLGRAIDAGAEVTVDDLVGGDVQAFAALKDLVFEGLVTMKRDLGFEHPSVKRVPTLVVRSDKIVADPDPDYGWQRNGRLFGSDDVQQRWERECAVAKRDACVPYFVAPGAALRLRDGTFLRPGDEVTLQHFRHRRNVTYGSQLAQLRLLVELHLVLMADDPRRCAGNDGPQAA